MTKTPAVLGAMMLVGCTTAGGEMTGAAITAPASAPVGVGTPAERLPTDIRRATIIVRDMDASLQLYRDVVGMQIKYDTVVETSGVALPAGEPGAKVRLVLLNSNDPLGRLGRPDGMAAPSAGSRALAHADGTWRRGDRDEHGRRQWPVQGGKIGSRRDLHRRTPAADLPG